MKQETNNKIVEYVKRFFYIMGGVAIGMTLATLMAGCAQKVITVPEYHQEHHYHTDSVIQRDSFKNEKITTIRELDSAAMARYGIQLKNAERAWLVETETLKEQIRELMRMRNDSAHKVDSIPVPYPVEKKLTRWQQAKLDLGGWMMGVILVSFIFFCIYLARGKVLRGK